VGEILRNNPHIKDANLIKPGDKLKMGKRDLTPRVRPFSEIEEIESDFNRTASNTDAIHHHYIRNKNTNNYIIDDKKNGHLSIYNQGKLIKRWAAIHGKNKESDDLTITKTDAKGKLINKGGNMSTPAGVFFT
jgi:hypothetical protein